MKNVDINSRVPASIKARTKRGRRARGYQSRWFKERPHSVRKLAHLGSYVNRYLPEALREFLPEILKAAHDSPGPWRHLNSDYSHGPLQIGRTILRRHSDPEVGSGAMEQARAFLFSELSAAYMTWRAGSGTWRVPVADLKKRSDELGINWRTVEDAFSEQPAVWVRMPIRGPGAGRHFAWGLRLAAREAHLRGECEPPGELKTLFRHRDRRSAQIKITNWREEHPDRLIAALVRAERSPADLPPLLHRLNSSQESSKNRLIGAPAALHRPLDDRPRHLLANAPSGAGAPLRDTTIVTREVSRLDAEWAEFRRHAEPEGSQWGRGAAPRVDLDPERGFV